MKEIGKILKRIKEEIKKHFINEKTGHDISHLERVTRNAKKIQRREGGDLYVVMLSAMLHDIHRIMINEKNVFISPNESLPLVKDILVKCNADNDKIEHILNVVEHHDKKMVGGDFDIETQIIQDADALDAIGKIGLKRTVTYCKTRGIPVFDVSAPFDSEEFVPEIHPISTCHYIYRVMIPQAKSLNTKTAQHMVKDSMDIMEKFIKQYCEEKR